MLVLLSDPRSPREGSAGRGRHFPGRGALPSELRQRGRELRLPGGGEQSGSGLLGFTGPRGKNAGSCPGRGAPRRGSRGRTLLVGLAEARSGRGSGGRGPPRRGCSRAAPLLRTAHSTAPQRQPRFTGLGAPHRCSERESELYGV